MLRCTSDGENSEFKTCTSFGGPVVIMQCSHILLALTASSGYSPVEEVSYLEGSMKAYVRVLTLIGHPKDLPVTLCTTWMGPVVDCLRTR